MGDEIKVALKNCEVSNDELARLEKALKSVKHPKSLIYNIGKDITINGKQIYGMVKKLVKDHSDHEFKDFGKDIGQILEVVLIPA